MRFAAIADIHGNCLALEAVLDDIAAQGIGDVVNLGDHLSGPLEAAKTADILMQREFTTIRGNHDRWLIEHERDRMGSWDRDAYNQLGRDHIAWLKSLPATATFRDEVFLCHATPDDDNIYWLEAVTADGRICAAPIEDIEAHASGIDASLILCGHTHLRRIVRLRDGRMIVNPGSVGCPGFTYDVPVPHKVEAATPDACYAILERTPRGWSTTFRLVPYDHMAMADLARRKGRHEWATALERLGGVIAGTAAAKHELDQSTAMTIVAVISRPIKAHRPARTRRARDRIAASGIYGCQSDVTLVAQHLQGYAMVVSSYHHVDS